MIIQERPDFQYIHGHYASLVVHRKKLQTESETTSVPLYNLRNHCIVSQQTILIPAASVDFPDVERDTAANWLLEFSKYETGGSS